MRFLLRPVCRGLGNALAWFVALWGFEVTADLLLLVAVTIVVGLANFAIALHDERKLRHANALSERQAERIDGLLSSLEGLQIKAPSIPLNVQDLANASPAELRRMVAELSGRMRLFEAKWLEERDKPGGFWTLSHNTQKSLSEEAIGELWHRDKEERIENYLRRSTEFKATLYADAQALWEELLRRTPPELHSERAPHALRRGDLVGSNPIEEAAVELERLARLLPDGNCHG